MEDNIKKLLKEYGLDENETTIFLLLVRKKELTAYRISKETKVHRSTCYDILERLIAKGFVSKIEKDGTLYYSANEISKVISSIKSKEFILQSLIPKLEVLESGEETKIKFLEGIEGQKQFNYHIFSIAKSRKISFLYIIGNTYASTEGSNIFIERLINESESLNLKNKIKYKGIWNSKFKNEKILKKYSQLGENKFLENIPSNVGTIIHDEGIALLYSQDKPYCIEIKNKLIAIEFKSYFEYLWNISKRIVCLNLQTHNI